MFVIVPSTVTQIDTTEKRQRLVDDHDLLVMRPQKNARPRVIRVSQNLYILGTALHQSLLAIVTVYAQSDFDFLVYQYEYLNAFELRKATFIP